MIGATWFRYEDHDVNERFPYLFEFTIIRETNKCVVIDQWGKKKFILKDARKRYAYPTKELALESYIIRKQREIGYASAKHNRAVENLALAKRLQTGEVGEFASVFDFKVSPQI